MCTKYRGLMFSFEQMSRNGSYVYRKLSIYIEMSRKNYFFLKINIDKYVLHVVLVWLYGHLQIHISCRSFKKGYSQCKLVSRFFILEDISKGSVHRKHHRKTRNNIHNLLNKNHTSLHNQFNFLHLVYIKKIGQTCM